MKHWKQALISGIIAVFIGAGAAGFTARIITEHRLTALETMVIVIRDDVQTIKAHLLRKDN